MPFVSLDADSGIEREGKAAERRAFLDIVVS
jgi:hypothetical protein